MPAEISSTWVEHHWVQDLWANFRAVLAFDVWRGEGYSLSIGGILFALLMLGGGALLASLVSRAVIRRLPERIRKSDQTTSGLQRLIFSAIWLVFIFWTLSYLQIPLTAFAFLGGALALGFGFGAQNICNNMISGLIILLEHPYRVGDVLDMSGKLGTVRRIGLRATELRLSDGITVLVPNSYFIANNIYNRSTRSNLLRGTLDVSVAYESDTRMVEQVLVELAGAHEAVITKKGRAPFVLFSGFGDSSITFTLYFWVNTAQAGVGKVASDLRHAILPAFQQHGIVIPFPQVDVHTPGNGNT